MWGLVLFNLWFVFVLTHEANAAGLVYFGGLATTHKLKMLI